MGIFRQILPDPIGIGVIGLPEYAQENQELELADLPNGAAQGRSERDGRPGEAYFLYFDAGVGKKVGREGCGPPRMGSDGGFTTPP